MLPAAAYRYALLVSAVVTLLAACSDTPPGQTEKSTATAQPIDGELLNQTTMQAWHLQTNAIASALEQAQVLQQRINQFAQHRSSDNLVKCRQQWLQAHNSLRGAAILFALADVSPALFAQLRENEYLIDAYPILPGYLDYVGEYLHTGLVNDRVIPINAEAIRRQHGFSDPSEVSLGFHAIEFLLWGEDGNRPLEDFLAEAQPDQIVDNIDSAHQRRLTLMQLQATLLVDDLKALHFRLHQQASAIQSAYLALPAASRVQLWRSALNHLLINLSNEGIHSNSPGSPQILKELQAIVGGVERMLFPQNSSPMNLATVLVGESQTQALRNGLERCSAMETGDTTVPTICAEIAAMFFQ